MLVNYHKEMYVLLGEREREKGGRAASVVQSLPPYVVHRVLFLCTQSRVAPVSERLEGNRTQRTTVRYPGVSPYPLRRGRATEIWNFLTHPVDAASSGSPRGLIYLSTTM